MSSEGGLTVGRLLEALAGEFPLGDAEPWDNVGLVVGRPSDVMTRVLVTLDATAEAVARAQRVGADVLVTHHPPFIGPTPPASAGPGPAGTIAAALTAGVALIVMHTNADRSAAGASILPSLLGLQDMQPLECGVQEVTLVQVYAPPESAPRVMDAMTAAGAGRVGTYSRCAFISAGTGYFEAGSSSRPTVDSGSSGVREVRIEMVSSRPDAPEVIAAAANAHPYEEPVIVAMDAVRARGGARLGRVGMLDRAVPLDAFARQVASVLDVAVRVWGARERVVQRVAVGNGSAGGLIGSAVSAGADVLVAGEVRYHDALGAVARGLAIIEAGHDATEWPLVGVLADAVARVTGEDLVVRESRETAWWTTEASDDAR